MTDQVMVTVTVDDYSIEVAPKFEGLTSCLLRSGTPILDIYQDNDKDYATIVFAAGEIMEDFLHSIRTSGKWDLVFPDEMFGTIASGPEEDAGALYFVEIPEASLEALKEVFKEFGGLVDSMVANSDPGIVNMQTGLPVNLSDITPVPWPGDYASVVGIESLKPGDSVKVIFDAGHPTHMSERMWVDVASIDGDRVIGVLSNEPVIFNNLHLGDRVTFRLHHITEVRDTDTPRILN